MGEGGSRGSRWIELRGSSLGVTLGEGFVLGLVGGREVLGELIRSWVGACGMGGSPRALGWCGIPREW